VKNAFARASKLLEDVLQSGQVEAVGVQTNSPSVAERKIERIEWSSRRLDIRRNMLATPFGEHRGHFPAFVKVRVSVEDLRRAASEAIEQGHRANAPDIETSPLSDEELDRLIRSLAAEHGKILSQNKYADKVREIYPQVSRNHARDRVKAVFPNLKQGRGARKYCAERGAQFRIIAQ
jgi:hypothetical protein